MLPLDDIINIIHCYIVVLLAPGTNEFDEVNCKRQTTTSAGHIDQALFAQYPHNSQDVFAQRRVTEPFGGVV